MGFGIRLEAAFENNTISEKTILPQLRFYYAAASASVGCGFGIARGVTIDTINAFIPPGVSAAEPVVFALVDEDNATIVWSRVFSDDAVDAANVATDEHSTSGTTDGTWSVNIIYFKHPCLYERARKPTSTLVSELFLKL